MPLSKNEIKSRAAGFVEKWKNETSEEAEAKPFLEDFFKIFGVERKRIATFEHKVKKLNDNDGYIDLFWKATILIEMKSRGRDLNKAFQQAKDYLHNIPEYELPRYILVSDFFNFQLYSLEDDSYHHFVINDLLDNLHYFDFIAGYEQRVFKEQDPVNIEAAERLGKLRDKLEDIGYNGHELEVYLVRILFCLFADNTGIFNRQQFQFYIEDRTQKDGSDLASKLHEIFYILNTPNSKRLKNLDEQLNAFPYINGKLFEESLPPASFDSEMRNTLLYCCYLDWSKISPAIFGSMFQSVMDPKERRNLGAHYTSEKNILKLIKPLFLDELWQEFETAKNNEQKLADFHNRLSKLRFLDPACGCGNFLIITYRELRLLEIEVLKHKISKGQLISDINLQIRLNVDMMYGIEIEEFPARVAEVAMWLIDHQLNNVVSSIFGEYFIRIPLDKSANIHNTNALQIDWNDIIPKNQLSYIIGNPPFIGSKMMTAEQRALVVAEADNIKGSGTLDFVTAWYFKAAKYIQNTKIKAALVSTNSIVQGEQVGIVWKSLIERFNIYIHFAHRTFKWTNEAKGKAAVYCVIVGFANFDTNEKFIFHYDDIKGEPLETKAKFINAYLVDAPNVIMSSRQTPLCDVPEMSFGNMPLDGGNLMMNDEEKQKLVETDSKVMKYLKRVYGGDEFLNNKIRWCLWLVDANPDELKKMPEVLKRIEKVKKFRLNSVAASTRKFADTAAFFRDRRLSKSYAVLPKVNATSRKYIPIGFFSDEKIATDLLFIIPSYQLFHFGVISSVMHNIWVQSVCGRLGNQIRYSKDIVYNNFPWPLNPSEKQVQKIEEKAQLVLDTRAKYPDSSLAVLYDPLTMPPDLVKAHSELDKAVDKAYRSAPFTSEAERLEFLFQLYQQYTATIFTKEKKKRGRKKL